MPSLVGIHLRSQPRSQPRTTKQVAQCCTIPVIQTEGVTGLSFASADDSVPWCATVDFDESVRTAAELMRDSQTAYVISQVADVDLVR